MGSSGAESRTSLSDANGKALDVLGKEQLQEDGVDSCFPCTSGNPAKGHGLWSSQVLKRKHQG